MRVSLRAGFVLLQLVRRLARTEYPDRPDDRERSRDECSQWPLLSSVLWLLAARAGRNPSRRHNSWINSLRTGMPEMKWPYSARSFPMVST